MSRMYDVVNKTRKKTDEIIWALNPYLDNSGDLFAFIIDYCLNYFEGSGIHVNIVQQAKLQDMQLRSRIRRDLFLVTKEICNNTLKYSKATEFSVKLDVTQKELSMYFEDNGVGFDLENQKNNGNGLKNMKQRIGGLRGNLEISSIPGKGTSYRITIKFSEMS